MTPSQHAKVLEALGRASENLPEISKVRELCEEALSIMRAEGVGDDAKDAERYRLLRSQSWDGGEFCVVMRPRENVRLGALCPSGTLLDDLVDAAAIRGRGE